MTYLEVVYRVAQPLSAAQMKLLGDLPGHYGIRRLRLEEGKGLLRIEYDASRLKETEVVHWVRGAGIPLTERVEASSPAA